MEPRGWLVMMMWKPRAAEAMRACRSRMEAAEPELRFDQRQRFQHRVDDFARRRHGGFEPIGNELHLRVDFVEVPGQAGAEVDTLFELRQRFFIGVRQAGVKHQHQPPLVLARKLPHLDLLRLGRGFPIHMAGASRLPGSREWRRGRGRGP